MTGTSIRQQMLATGECPRRHHKPDEHHHNACHHVDTWLGLHRREFRKCDCWHSGPDDWAAGALWNAYMGRAVQ